MLFFIYTRMFMENYYAWLLSCPEMVFCVLYGMVEAFRVSVWLLLLFLWCLNVVCG